MPRPPARGTDARPGQLRGLGPAPRACRRPQTQDTPPARDPTPPPVAHGVLWTARGQTQGTPPVQDPALTPMADRGPAHSTWPRPQPNTRSYAPVPVNLLTSRPTPRPRRRTLSRPSSDPGAPPLWLGSAPSACARSPDPPLAPGPAYCSRAAGRRPASSARTRATAEQGLLQKGRNPGGCIPMRRPSKSPPDPVFLVERKQREEREPEKRTSANGSTAILWEHSNPGIPALLRTQVTAVV
ncbi:uncharacterized protein LOC134471042 [Cavia porcellus]|uniref:uncharacterized protein LOC134471042 n=1 Tax=Cavia porcellus TaxID=10141 RepID=UPI002FE32D83